MKFKTHKYKLNRCPMEEIFWRGGWRVKIRGGSWRGTSRPKINRLELRVFFFFCSGQERQREGERQQRTRRGFDRDPIVFHHTPLIRRITRLDNDCHYVLPHGTRFHGSAFPCTANVLKGRAFQFSRLLPIPRSKLDTEIISSRAKT